MIRVNCQYNVGGFRLFKLCYNQEREYLLSEEAEHSIDAPIEALKYVNIAGIKFVYQHLASGGYVIVITDIDSIYTDDAGRATKSAVIFSADATERDTMDNIAIDILNDRKRFELFFSNLFSFYHGFNIRYDGEKIAEYIQEMQKKKNYDGEASFMRIFKKSSDILCLIPIYASWTKDVQEKIARELSLDSQWFKKALILTSELWDKEQRLLTITNEAVEDQDVTKKPAEETQLVESKGEDLVGDFEFHDKPEKRSKWQIIVDVCLAALTYYFKSWSGVIKKRELEKSVLMQAFIVSQVIIGILLIILACVVIF